MTTQQKEFKEAILGATAPLVAEVQALRQDIHTLTKAMTSLTMPTKNRIEGGQWEPEELANMSRPDLYRAGKTVGLNAYCREAGIDFRTFDNDELRAQIKELKNAQRQPNTSTTT